MDKEEKGWGFLVNAKKYHYFVNRQSVCGKWLRFNLENLEDDNDDSPDNCTACKKVVKTIRLTKEKTNVKTR